jgi:lipopolysaccharide/colanic/teichoic acid biosynthesis glycosyltransferase
MSLVFRPLLLLIIILCVVKTSGCALALPVIGTGSALNSEYKFRKLKHRVEENSRIIDFLLEERQNQTIK